MLSKFAMTKPNRKQWNIHKNDPTLNVSDFGTVVSKQLYDRKTMMLCAQIRYALEYAINTALKGEKGVTVVDVVPAPNLSHLLVFVQSLDDLNFEETISLQTELSVHSQVLRSAISQSIHRKKTPGLSFQIVPRRVVSAEG